MIKIDTASHRFPSESINLVAWLVYNDLHAKMGSKYRFFFFIGVVLIQNVDCVPKLHVPQGSLYFLLKHNIGTKGTEMG